MGMVKQRLPAPMSGEDRRAIERYAAAGVHDPSIDMFRTAAVEAFRRYLRDTPKARWNVHMKFMSEIDTKAPDYGLRAMYRRQLLEEIGPKLP